MSKHQEVLISKVEKAVENMIGACQELDAEFEPWIRPPTEVEKHLTLKSVLARLNRSVDDPVGPSVSPVPGYTDLRHSFGLCFEHKKRYAKVYDKLSEEERALLGVAATAPSNTATELSDEESEENVTEKDLEG